MGCDASGTPRHLIRVSGRGHLGHLSAVTHHEHGIYLVEARGTVIRDNWIYDNADRGVQLYPDADGSRITGNVIDDNGQGIVFSGTGSSVSSNTVVRGNIVSNSNLRWNAYSGTEGPRATGN
jgi:nitrous oxidase accessory protein NosD